MAKPMMKQPSKEEKVQALLRELSVKKEQMFLGILYNSINAGKEPSPELVDKAIATADYALEKLYTLPEEKKESDK